MGGEVGGAAEVGEDDVGIRGGVVWGRAQQDVRGLDIAVEDGHMLAFVVAGGGVQMVHGFGELEEGVPDETLWDSRIALEVAV